MASLAGAENGRAVTEAARASTGPRLASELVRGLGYFSLGLGAVQLLAPAATNRLIGVRDDHTTRRWQRLVGAQELLAAAAILPRRRPVETLWGRTSADIVHLAMLAVAYRTRRSSAARLGLAAGSVVGCLAADAFASVRMTTDPDLEQEGRAVTGHAAITIRASREELVARWQEFEQGEHARLGPVEILDGEPAAGVRWRTAPGAARSAEGVLRLREAPGSRGCEIHIDIASEVPGGSVGAALQKVSGEEPLQLVRDDLRRLKQLLETGEIARSDGAPGGSSAKTQPKQRPAQPLVHAGS
jgi:uncharacterized membrane protein